MILLDPGPVVVQVAPAPAPKPEHAAWEETIRACIIYRESRGDPTARNTASTASGLYQFLRGTWQAVTGLPGDAADYPPVVQTAAFWKLWDHGKGKSNWDYPKDQCW